MTTKNDGGAAFPRAGFVNASPGMSLRDWFAGQALAGLASSWDLERNTPFTETVMVGAAYRLADDMLAHRLAKPITAAMLAARSKP